MAQAKISTAFTQSLKDFIKNPIILTIPLLIFISNFILTEIANKVNHSLTSTLYLSISLVIFLLFTLLVLSFFFSSLIGLSKDIIKNLKPSLKKSLSYGKKFWLKNFAILLLIIILYNLNRIIAHYLSFFIGKLLNLQLQTAQMLFLSIYFIILVCVLTFFTFSSFFLVIKQTLIIESIKRSINFVKKQFFLTIFILIVFFGIIFIFDFYSSFATIWKINFIELAKTILVYPYLCLVFTRFLLNFENDLPTK